MAMKLPSTILDFDVSRILEEVGHILVHLKL